MISSLFSTSARWPLLRAALALIAGGVFVLGFAPVSFWFGPLLAVLLLFALLDHSRPRIAFLLGFLFGVGQFGLGVSWVYNSLSLFGGLVEPVAGVMTGLFVLLLSIYTALFGWLYSKLTAYHRTAPLFARLLLFAALWVLVEYLRSWLFGGFPWLNLGVAQFSGPLAGWLPLTGEYGTALVAVIFAAALLTLVVTIRQNWSRGRAGLNDWKAPIGQGFLVMGLLLVAWLGDRAEFTQTHGHSMNAAVVQGNIPQMQKFDPEIFGDTLRLYFSLTDELEQPDLVVWPETAIPQVLTFLPRLHDDLRLMAAEGDYVLLAGAFTEQDDQYFNALVGVPDPVGTYHKQHLVPFGEYFPLRWVVELFPGIYDVPMADLTPGQGSALMQVGEVLVGASICYEMDFARDIRPSILNAGFLVTVSNDSWFGERAAGQHLEIARVRAYEFRRPIVRATNTGVSALIDHRGVLLTAIDWDIRGVAQSMIEPRTGATPVTYYGAGPAVFGSIALLLTFLGLYRRRAAGQ